MSLSSDNSLLVSVDILNNHSSFIIPHYFTTYMDLQELRQQIDEIDNDILQLLNKRMEVVKQVGALKKTTNSIIYRPEREKAIIDRLASLNQGKTLNRSAIEAIYLEIFAVSRNVELPERISYLGPEGSFTHQAAESRFGGMSDYISLPSIRSVFESVDTGRVRFGVVPLENNREGIVNETIDLLYEMDIKIVAEVLLPIHHTFATKCHTLGEIKRVYSKDIAFRQCQRFLRRIPGYEPCGTDTYRIYLQGCQNCSQ
jgi:chorismate mutase/prephenate dehydratase